MLLTTANLLETEINLTWTLTGLEIRVTINCRSHANIGQEDTDGDLIGNVCDNCPNMTNFDQADSDQDGVGNECDNCPNSLNSDQREACV
jgi:hypothetical protein